jgi:hypothetical protein
MVVHETASSRIRRKNQSGDLIDHETWKVQQEEFFFPRFSPSGNRWPPTTTVSCRRQNPPAPAIHRFVRWVCGPERRRIVLWGDAPRTRRSAYKAQAIFFLSVTASWLRATRTGRFTSPLVCLPFVPIAELRFFSLEKKKKKTNRSANPSSRSDPKRGEREPGCFRRTSCSRSPSGWPPSSSRPRP